MPRLDLVYFSTTSNDLPNLIGAARAQAEHGLFVNLRAYTKAQLISEKGKADFVVSALQADAVVVTLMGGESSCPVWDELIAALGEARREKDAPYFHVQPTGANQEAWQAAVDQSDGVEGGPWNDLNAYYRHGGRGNAEQFLRLLCNTATGACLPLRLPETPPTEGVYHPDWPDNPPLEDYLASLDPAKPLIGIWFYQNLWVNGAVKHIDAFIRAVEAQGGQAPESFAGDSSDPERVKVRTAAEEAKHVFRARLLNPKWVRGLMRHGYKGAGDVSKAVDVAFGWDATADVVDDFMYKRLAQRVAFDPEVRKWMERVNPTALHNISEKLLEAIGRGMWRADEQTHQKLLQLYLDTEGEVEQAMDSDREGGRP